MDSTEYTKRTDKMYLVYLDEGGRKLVYLDKEGKKYYQHWDDLQESGTLINPETGEDLKLIGWAIPS